MGYRGVAKDSLIVLEEGIKLPEGMQVEVTPIKGMEKGIPSELLEVGGQICLTRSVIQLRRLLMK